MNLFSGQELPSTSGLTCGGVAPVDMGMSYNPIDAYNNVGGTATSVGFGWTLDYDITFLPFNGPQKRLLLPPNEAINFVDDGAGNYKSFDDPRFEGAVFRAIDANAGIWDLNFKDGRKWRFQPFLAVPIRLRNTPPSYLTEIFDTSGNVVAITRQSNGRISSVGNPDRNVSMSYGANGFVSEMRDTANRTNTYTYTPSNRIAGITDADNKLTSYTYVNDTEIAPDTACAASQPTLGERIKSIQYPGRPTPTVKRQSRHCTPRPARYPLPSFFSSLAKYLSRSTTKRS